MDHLKKSWLLPLSGLKKFISSVFSYNLSKLLDRKKFEVVNESYIDVHDLNSEQPDVVIYDRENNFKTVLMVEFSDHNDLDATLRTVELISKIYEIPEAFVYDLDEQKWFSVREQDLKQASSSRFFGIDLQKILAQSLDRYRGKSVAI